LNSKSRVYELVILAILSACNAVLETSVGNYLFALRVPFFWSVLVGLNVIVYIVGYSQVPKRGTILIMGFITALLNLILGGAVKIWSVPCIFLEAVLVEAVISTLGFGFWQVITASSLTNLLSFILTVMYLSFVRGYTFLGALLRDAEKVINNTEVLNTYFIIVLVLLVLIHLVSGAFFGWFAWKINNRTVVTNRKKLFSKESGLA
jgi:hypothetical protein